MSDAEAALVLKRDVRGNRDNVRYGSLERSTVPRYRLSGHGRVVGLGREHRILTSSDTRRDIVATGTDPSRRQKKDSLSSSVAQAHPKLITATKGPDDDIQRQSDFVSLGGSSKRRKLSGIDDRPFSIRLKDASQGDDDESFEDSDNSTKNDGPTNAWDAFRNDTIQLRHRQLMKQTVDDPENLKTWLSLVAHQEALVKGADSTESRKLNGTQRRTLITMRIAIYEQALAKVKQSGPRQHLISGLMREGAKIWHHEKQLSEWQSLLVESSSHNLRLLHLEFLMSNSQSFAFGAILGTSMDYLHETWRLPPSSSRNENFVALLLRATTFMMEAGYSERAVSIWQAHLEIAFFWPTDAAYANRSSFENFWDNEYPRIGEPDARGWAKSIHYQAPLGSNQPESRANGHQADFATWPSWMATECQSQAASLLPAKALEDTKDPFRVVLFPDIDSYLFFDPPADIRRELLQSFLLFCGLPAYASPDPLRRSMHDQYSCRVDSQFDEENMFMHARSFMPVDTLSLFADGSQQYCAFTAPSNVSTHESIARAALHQLVPEQGNDEDLAEYALAFELYCDKNSARKLAKRLLKQRGNSLRLYNAYALIEARATSLAAAEKVWTAVVSSQPATGSSVQDRWLLIRAWAWTCTTVRQSKRTLQVIAWSQEGIPVAQAQPESLPAADIAKAEEYLWSQWSLSYSQSKLDDLAVITDLLALLHYHSANGSLSNALKIFEKCSLLSTFKEDPVKMARSALLALQQLHVNRNRLIDVHTSFSNVEFRPRQIINLLEGSCQIFPNNLTFRQHLNAFTQKHGGLDRLRRAVSTDNAPSLPHNDSTLIAHLSSINTALNLPLHQGGTQHVIRATFQDALLPNSSSLTDTDISVTTSIRSCPGINIAFLRWELHLLRNLTPFSPKEEGEGHRRIPPQQTPKREEKARKKQAQNVKAAFQTAVTNCPWVKEIYLAYFDELLEYDVEEREWAEVYDGMLERGLRICVER